MFDVENVWIKSVEFFIFILIIRFKIYGIIEFNIYIFIGGVLVLVLVFEFVVLGGGLDNDTGFVIGEVLVGFR